MRTPKLLAAIAAISLFTAACSEETPGNKVDGTTTTVAQAVVDCQTAESVVACAPDDSTIDKLLPAKATKATGAPIRIGTINQDTGPLAAFPELTSADQMAIDFINTELNGVDGRPLELITCDTQGSPDISQSCAQQMVTKKVVAVIGGIDIWGTGIQTLVDNGIPLVGGIPVSFDSVRGETVFQFSAGTWGAAVGMAQYAMDTLKAKKIAVIHAEFPPITDAGKLVEKAIIAHGGTPAMITVPIIGGDMAQALNQAAATDPDAVLALTADTGCVPTMKTAKQIDLKVPLMFTGACAAPTLIDSVGDAAEGIIFNLESDLTPNNPDSVLYRAAANRYGPKYKYEAQSAGTLSFKSTMILYGIMRNIGGDKVTPEAILAGFRAAKNEPGFSGHPFTCDGKQFPGYPAMCSPQQTLGQLKDGAIQQVTPWLDIAAWLKQ